MISAEWRLNEILHRKNLSVTDSRRKILKLFLSSKDALTHSDIENSAAGSFDRVVNAGTAEPMVAFSLWLQVKYTLDNRRR